MDKPIGFAHFATDEASYPIYDDMLKMTSWQQADTNPTRRVMAPRLWVDDAIDETTCEALTELTETFPDWSGIDPGDRNAI